MKTGNGIAGLAAAFRETTRCNPGTGEDGIIREEWRVLRASDIPYGELRAALHDRAAASEYVLQHRYIRYGEDRGWEYSDGFRDRLGALGGIDREAVPADSDDGRALADIQRMRREREAEERLKAEGERKAQEAANGRRERKEASQAAFRRMMASTRYEPLARAWNAAVERVRAWPPDAQERLKGDEGVRELQRQVIEATMVPAKAKAIRACLALLKERYGE